MNGNHFSKADLSGPSYFISYEFVLVKTSIPLENMNINIKINIKDMILNGLKFLVLKTLTDCASAL